MTLPDITFFAHHTNNECISVRFYFKACMYPPHTTLMLPSGCAVKPNGTQPPLQPYKVMLVFYWPVLLTSVGWTCLLQSGFWCDPCGLTYDWSIRRHQPLWPAAGLPPTTTALSHGRAITAAVLVLCGQLDPSGPASPWNVVQ